MSDLDLTTVIEDAVSDLTLPEDPESTADPTDTPAESTTVEATAEPVEATSSETPTEESTSEVASPGARNQEADPFFDKKLGIPSQSNGRENRIPYSRVQKIVANAEKQALKPLQEKLAVLEPQLAQLTPKIQEYEGRLAQVAEFEEVMVNQPQRFLQMIEQLPAYQPFFQMVRQLSAQAQGLAQAQPQTVAEDKMPEPDEKQPDGTAVYSMEGLKKLLDWQSRQVETRVAERYRPLEERAQFERQERARQEHLNQVIRSVDQQIAEARTWPLFTESEDAITQYLAANANASLEAAYRAVVLPKLQANRDQMRTSLIEEINKVPRTTSAPAVPLRPNSASNTPSGPRSLEDVIADSIKSAGQR